MPLPWHTVVVVVDQPWWALNFDHLLRWLHQRWHGPLTVQVQSSGRPPKDFKQSFNIFSGDVIPGRCGLSAHPLGENFCFLQFLKSNIEIFFLSSSFYRSANVPFHLFPHKSVIHIMNQSSKHFHTRTFRVCHSHRGLGLDLGFRFSYNRYSQTFSGHGMYSFSISINEHVPPKFSYDKKQGLGTFLAKGPWNLHIFNSIIVCPWEPYNIFQHLMQLTS